MRETHEWTDAELTYLETWYCLRGGAFIRATYPHLTPNGIRQMATRLSLFDDLREYTPLRVVAREAGITEHSLREWLRARLWARKRCVKQGRTLMLPLPVVRLLLPSTRRPVRPRGWLGSEQAADRLGVNGSLVRRLCLTGVLEAVQVRGEWFVDPSCLPARKPTQPPPNHISVQALAAVSGLSAKCWHAGVEKVEVKRPVGRPAAFTHEKQARAFLSARGHRGEQVETVLRRAVALDVARVKI